MRIAVLALALGPALAACDAGPAPPPPQSAGVTADSTRLYTAPEEVGLRFRTTVPAGVLVQSLPTDSGSAVRFVATWGDERDERTFLHFAVAPAGTSEQAVRETVNAVAESYRVIGDRSELERLPPEPWAVEKYPIRSTGTVGDPLTGWVALGSHGGRWFHIIVQSPQELQEEFAPMVEEILDGWEWVDDGQPLRRPQAYSDARPDRR